MPEIAGRFAMRVSRRLPGPLALSQLPSARLLSRVAQPGRQAVYPRELHENVAADGTAGGPRSRPAYRDVQHDDSKIDPAAARCANQARAERNGAAPAFPASGAI